MMNRDSRPPFGLDSLSALSKPSASSPKLFNSLLLGPSMAQSKPEGSSLRDLLNSGPGQTPPGPWREWGTIPLCLYLSRQRQAEDQPPKLSGSHHRFGCGDQKGRRPSDRGL
ncbi:Lysine-specific demethylase 3B [Larimichthys crocea]|uniref:Uncharacterized protein n=1 Tax=Larimichthys crocea TaxID=215358 RepID=A0ACD3REN5_LARCR|nr:Lysine-specific demethylase 3B [Larimichthys crocea]